MQAHEGIEQLKVNLKKEHDLKVDYMTAVWISVSLHLLQMVNLSLCRVQILWSESCVPSM